MIQIFSQIQKKVQISFYNMRKKSNNNRLCEIIAKKMHKTLVDKAKRIRIIIFEL